MYTYTCTDACSHSNQGVGPRRGDWDTHGGNTGSYIFVCNYQMCVEQMLEVRWTSIHVMIYVHILPKV